MNAKRRYRVRAFEPRDAEDVAQMFADFMAENLNFRPSPVPLNAKVILAEGQGKKFRTVVAVDESDNPIGYAMWVPTFDFHHAVDGAAIQELYVQPRHRGRALSFRLAAAIAKRIQKDGGTFLTAPVLTDDAKRLKLVRRATVGFSLEQVYLSGRGFRELIELEDADIKTLVRKLPKPEATKEP